MTTTSKLFGTAVAAAVLFATAPTFAQDALEVSFADAEWTGESVPDGQHCSLQGGSGATPALNVSGVPDGTTEIHVAYSDETYQPMNNGGHGTIGFNVTPADGMVSLPSVPGETDALSEPAFVAAPNATSGDFLAEGYMPPCSGGNGNTYSAQVTALDDAGTVLASGDITLGTY
ncbi:hypothetical protein V6617_15890 [Pelagibacterium nitratireducens]|mgnify:FL=1|jgi:hypothetical protein|uniref:Secreted protein n=1 Tax=Pelagibacterium nitratireducens TaxID=1046114 RepID=A0ABZ2HY15_9HYPH|tara:strand:- start:1130 stop:1651 length:522 start_codon:yes stop_codon:yes gene_type:complete